MLAQQLIDNSSNQNYLSISENYTRPSVSPGQDVVNMNQTLPVINLPPNFSDDQQTLHNQELVAEDCVKSVSNPHLNASGLRNRYSKEAQEKESCNTLVSLAAKQSELLKSLDDLIAYNDTSLNHILNTTI